ncbi:DoxX family membrane protein [Aquimarina sp. RZ0]|uniref:DoxX family membrane protein n=1 Tax=Aquimarina sp. RZ0 TaxID=2607730 RepID=UPI0011F2BD47|nr:DoxX family membrane protein [Aquimarina sp. RZ0]KAA1242820.1 DoxX family membrane protein [Aquimarina sp. RZ0]
MNVKLNLYTTIRVVFGLFLVLHGVCNAVLYSDFLNRIDAYFTKAKIFDIELIEALAPLVPFEEFVIGLFLVLGFFIKRALIAAILLFTFIVLFLLDVDSIELAILHIGFFFVALLLWRKDSCSIDGLNYSRDLF